MHSLVLGPFPTLWPTFGTAVLIDDYCINNEKSVPTQEVAYKIATSHFKDQKYNDDLYETITRLHNICFQELAKQLNVYHGVDYSHRYWGLIISHWLMRCIEDLVKTYTEVSQTINENNFSSVKICNLRTNDLTPNSSFEYAHLRLKEKYIVILRSETIRSLNLQNNNVNIVEKAIVDESTKRFDLKDNTRLRILKNLNRLTSRITRAISRRAKIYVESSYLPFWSEIILKISLWQSPAMRKILENQNSPIDSRFRYHILAGVNSSQPLDQFVFSNIIWLLPRTYLEDYKAMNTLIGKSFWPKRPNVIFTANSFDTDDEFKIWSAQKIIEGTVYVVMQHGNNFGTYRYPIHPEIRLADYFFTWGWSYHPNEIPLFCQTIKREKKISLVNSESLLILRRQVPLRESITDHPNMLRESLQEENESYAELKQEIRLSARFKRHPASKYKNDISNFESEVIEKEKKFIADHIPIRKLYSSYKIVYFECYSSGVLECLSLNIPTVFIWPEGLNSIRNECVEDFNELEKNHILFLNGVEAAAHINNVWSNVDGWWKTCQVQDARRKFIEKYARSTDHPIRNLRNRLKNIERANA
jgi:putative transferase (TIGR04331 family)